VYCHNFGGYTAIYTNNGEYLAAVFDSIVEFTDKKEFTYKGFTRQQMVDILLGQDWKDFIHGPHYLWETQSSRVV
jgi:hypothetical protein